MANGIKSKVTSVTAEQVAKAVTTGTPVHKEKVSQLIYVGPNLLGLPKYTVVESLKVPHIKGFIDKCPEVEKMFVPIAEMAEKEARIQKKGTLEHRHFTKVTEFKFGKGEQ